MSTGDGVRPARDAPSVVLSILVASLVVVTTIALGEPLLELSEPVARNYNEGWNAFRASAVVEGEGLYPDRGSAVFNNYPPLSFHLVATLVRAGGDAIVAGRVVALAALGIVAAAIGFIVATLTGRASRGWLAVLLVLAWFAIRFPHYVAMNDPQMTGHALQYVGLAVLIRCGRSRVSLLGSMLLLLCGGLVKHVLLPVPLGVATWLSIERRRDFVVWVLAAGAATAIALGTVARLYGAPALEGIFLHERALHVHLFAIAVQNWFVPLVPLLGAAATLLVLGPHRSRERLVLITAGWATLVAVGVSFGAGVTYNAVFDLAFAAVILAVLGFDRMRRLADGGSRARWYAPLLLGLVTANLFATAPLRGLHLVESAQGRDERLAQARADIAAFAAVDGPVLCENAALAYWAGKDYEVDFFNYGQRLATGADDGRLLIDRLRAREFDLVQLERPGGSARLSPAIDAAIAENYELARVSEVNGWIYRPLPPGVSAPRGPRTN